MSSNPIFRVLKKSKSRPKPGDVFAYQLGAFPDRYFFGRVVATDTKIGGIRDFEVVLIYLYRSTAVKKTDVPALEISDLLVPPIGTNTLPWSHGFFEVVKSDLPMEGKVLPQHCFRNSSGLYLDEYGNRLPGPIEPVGAFGLTGIGGIELRVADALGLS